MGLADVDHLHAGEVRSRRGGVLNAAIAERLFPRGIWRAALVFCGLGLVAAARAHTSDTSYCKVAIGREEVTFTFTFDLATLRRMAPIDTNRDNRITRAEFAAAMPALESFLRRSVHVELNEREADFGALEPPAWFAAADRIPASDYAQRLATLRFRNPVLHAPDSVALTFAFFGTLGEQHTVLGTFLWEGQENPVVFTRFEPDYLFDTGYRVPAFEQFRQYLGLGIRHIFLGYDHIAFLLALLFVRRFSDLIKVITAFTVSHTLTLALAALGVVSLPARLVESAIAISIIYVAAENLWRKSENERRWRIAFAFGLVHGFGFAAVLRELGLPAEGLVRSLLAFNLGVETGQLAIAALCWPLFLWVSQRSWGAGMRRAVSWTLLVFGAAWFIDRAFALRVMPI